MLYIEVIYYIYEVYIYNIYIHMLYIWSNHLNQGTKHVFENLPWSFASTCL